MLSRWLSAAMLGSMLLLPCASLRAQTPLTPSLFLGEQSLQHAAERAHQQSWADKAMKVLLKEADDYPANYEKEFGLTSPDLPPEGGQWGHYYACPDTGTELEFRPPDQHICPDNGKVFKGYPYDQVIYSFRADSLSHAAVNLALAYRLSGNHSYAEESAALLKAYGDRYLTYKLHDREGNTVNAAAHVFAQTLDESIWLIRMAWAYDLLRDTDVLSAIDRNHIENDFLRPAAEVVSRKTAPTLNWQAWDDTALASVGYILGDEAMIHKAIDGPEGALPLLRKCVVDGFWIEGSWHYQFYTMRAYAQLAEMALQHGRNLWQEEPRLKAFFESPLGVMLPNRDFPPFNDSKPATLSQYYYLYEAAYAATKDPLFEEILQASAREDEQALLFGVDMLPKDGFHRLSSEVFPEIGYARLSSTSSDLTEVLKFGPHGEVHGHFDALGEIIYSQGRVMSVDPGTQLYGVPSHETWDKQTVAHNTIVVDETTQSATTGKLLRWQSTPQFTAIEADAGPAYKNVVLTRRVVMTSRYILEITTARAKDGQKHTFDWIYHNFGDLQLAMPVEPWSGFSQTNGYQHLSNNRSALTGYMWQAEFHVAADASAGAGNMHLLMAAEPDTRIVTGSGLGPDIRVPVPYLMARRKAVSTQFEVVIEPHSGAAVIKSFELMPDGRYKIVAKDWVDIVTVGDQFLLDHVSNH